MCQIMCIYVFPACSRDGREVMWRNILQVKDYWSLKKVLKSVFSCEACGDAGINTVNKSDPFLAWKYIIKVDGLKDSKPNTRNP